MTQNFQERGKMLLSAAILLLGCSSAMADGHVNNMGCCEYKLVPGSMPKSGHYFLDTQPSDIIPDFCKDSCVYVKEKMPGDDPLPEGSRFCFKPSSTYTSECQDTGDGGLAIDSSSVVESTESKPSDSPGIEMDSPEMKPDSEPIINRGEGECKFEDELDYTSSADFQSYLVTVEVSDFTPMEGGWNLAVGLEVASGETVEDTIRDLTVRLLRTDIELTCYPNEGFGHGTDIGCYSDDDDEKDLPPGRYNLEVKVEKEIVLPMVKGLIYGGNNVCQDPEPIINKGEIKCNFREADLLDFSADGQSYVVTVDASDLTPKEGGFHFAIGLEVDPGETVEDTIRDLTVRLLDQDIELACYPREGFGHGTDIGCYTDDEKELPPREYYLHVKVVGVELPMIKGLIYGGGDFCQDVANHNSMDNHDGKK